MQPYHFTRCPVWSAAQWHHWGSVPRDESMDISKALLEKNDFCRHPHCTRKFLPRKLLQARLQSWSLESCSCLVWLDACKFRFGSNWEVQTNIPRSYWKHCHIHSRSYSYSIYSNVPIKDAWLALTMHLQMACFSRITVSAAAFDHVTTLHFVSAELCNFRHHLCADQMR